MNSGPTSVRSDHEVIVMDQDHNLRNDAARERLRAVVTGLSESQLRLPLSRGGWTVASALAHLAYWDRRNREQLEEWSRGGPGQVRSTSIGPDDTNERLLTEWLAMPPAEAVRQALAAAEETDHLVAALPEDMAEAILKARGRSVCRYIHRLEHLSEIEAALVRA